MNIYRTDLEMYAGTGDTIIYRKNIGTYNDQGKLISKTLSSFVATDTLEFTVKVIKDDVVPTIFKYGILSDGTMEVVLTALDTQIAEGTYIYDVFYTELGQDPICIVPPSNFSIIASVNYTPTGS